MEKKDTTNLLYWVDSIFCHELGGNCPVDFIQLHDGRVIGIDGESVVLYESWDDSESFDNLPRATIDLTK